MGAGITTLIRAALVDFFQIAHADEPPKSILEGDAL
jgi:hypothetical protein